MAACETLKANGVQPFEMGEKDDYRFGHLHSALNYKTYGCDMAEKLGTREVAYDGEEQKAIYQMIKIAPIRDILEQIFSVLMTVRKDHFLTPEKQPFCLWEPGIVQKIKQVWRFMTTKKFMQCVFRM